MGPSRQSPRRPGVLALSLSVCACALVYIPAVVARLCWSVLISPRSYDSIPPRLTCCVERPGVHLSPPGLLLFFFIFLALSLCVRGVCARPRGFGVGGARVIHRPTTRPPTSLTPATTPKRVEG